MPITWRSTPRCPNQRIPRRCRPSIPGLAPDKQRRQHGCAWRLLFLTAGISLRFATTGPLPEKTIPRFVSVNPQTFNAASNMINGNFVHTTGSLTSSTRFGYNKLYQLRIDKGFDIGLQGLSFNGMAMAGPSGTN